MHLTAPPGGRIREAGDAVDGLSEGFRFHDLRHYSASLLICKGLDVKVVQKSLSACLSEDDTRCLRAHAPTVKSPHELPLRKCWQHVRTL
jgi:integrase